MMLKYRPMLVFLLGAAIGISFLVADRQAGEKESPLTLGVGGGWLLAFLASPGFIGTQEPLRKLSRVRLCYLLGIALVVSGLLGTALFGFSPKGPQPPLGRVFQAAAGFGLLLAGGSLVFAACRAAMDPGPASSSGITALTNLLNTLGPDGARQFAGMLNAAGADKSASQLKDLPAVVPRQTGLVAHVPAGWCSGGASPFTCQECGVEAPTKQLELIQHIGAVVIRFEKSVKGRLCSKCIEHYFWKFTLVTVALGWWGVVSAIFTPIVLLMNLMAYRSARNLAPVPENAGPPQLTDEARRTGAGGSRQRRSYPGTGGAVSPVPHWPAPHRFGR
jgi:hypothetical protein